MDILSFLGSNVGVMALIIALVALVKPFIPSDKYYPLASVGIGVVVLTVLNWYAEQDIMGGILQGLVLGLSAAGLYDQKAIFK